MTVLLSDHFEKNLNDLTGLFAGDQTFTVRKVKNRYLPEVKLAVLLSGVMVGSETVSREIITRLESQRFDPVPAVIRDQVIGGHTVTAERDMETAAERICAGDCVVLIGDYPCCLIAETKGTAQRSNEMPETEMSLLGPQDGFNENLVSNLGLVKRRLLTPSFKCEFTVLGRQGRAKAAICYLQGIVKERTLHLLKKRLKSVDIDAVLDGNVLAELIRDCPRSVFKTVGKTGRPDVLVSKLLEGRVGVLIDGSPVALTVPYVFAEAFQSPDDYYQNAWYGSVGRVLRWIGFFSSFLIPGLYLALINFNPAALPAHWFYTILAASAGIPIHTVTEMILLFFAFELLREAGSRMPSGLGLALNIVGAVILGDAAVAGNIVSTPVVIVVAFSGVTGLLVSDLKGAVIYLRFLSVFSGALFGIPGVFLFLLCVWMSLAGTVSFEVPYLYPLIEKEGNQDTFYRTFYRNMVYRQRRFSRNLRRKRR